MTIPPLSTLFEVLLLQLGGDGRKEALLGESAERAASACSPFLVGNEMPDVYFEFPLLGDQFLDVTLLYGSLEPGTRIASPSADDIGAIIDWYAGVKAEEASISFGVELDTSRPQLPRAAVHFQPRQHTQYVRPFFEFAGEPERADLYLNQAARMPKGWELAFCGMFRGRPDSPLRVCGYLSGEQSVECRSDPAYLPAVFDRIGFTAYDEAMLACVRKVIQAAPGLLDFQFDVFPDGHLGDTFALDAQFGIEQPATVCKSFESGSRARFMELLEELGIADERWRLTPQAAFARALPLEQEDGTAAKLSFTLMPQWTKVRWTAGVLQPAKLYYLGKSAVL